MVQFLSDPPQTSAPPAFLLDRYRIIDMAGEGGYAPVYHAYDTRLKRHVAIKCIELSDSEVARIHLQTIEERVKGENSVGGFGGLGDNDVDGDCRDYADYADYGVYGDDGASEDLEGELPHNGRTFSFDDENVRDVIPGLEEAQTAAQLIDSHIVTVFDCVLSSSTAYIIMEYIEGKTLTAVLEELGDEIDLDVIAEVFESVSHALEVAHDGDVLHLDIKPDNVIITKSGVVKVTDFGLATLMDASGLGFTGGGTIGYMPLEQMRLQPLDVRTDEWALASLTYEMMVGENPFLADDLAGAERVIENAELLLPSLCFDDMNPELDDVIFEALNPEPDGRFSSIKEFAQALAPYLGDAKKGKRELAAVVKRGGENEDGEDAYEAASPRERLPLVDRVGYAGGVVIGRAIAAVSSALLAAVAGVNIHLQEASAFGLASDFTPLFWAIVIAFALAAILRPHLGALAGFSAFAIAVAMNGGIVCGAVLLVATVVWWWFLGRHESAAAVSALMQPLGGAVGCAAFAPLASGCFLPVKQALGNTAFCLIVAVTFASMGSGVLTGWGMPEHFIMHLGALDRYLLFVLGLPETWVIAASWLAAAALFSACCVRGTRTFDILGGLAGAACVIAGVIICCAMMPFGASLIGMTPTALVVVGAVIPGIAAIVAACLDIPDAYRSNYLSKSHTW